MEKLLHEIIAKMTILGEEMTDNVEKGNKAAGVRARKLSLELEKLFKDYRKQSIETAKK